MRDRPEISDVEVKEIRDHIARAERIQRFLGTDVWKLDLEPMLTRIQEEARARVRSIFRNGKRADQIAIEGALAAGEESAIVEICKRIERWIEDIDISAEKLKKHDEQKKREAAKT